MRNVIILNAMIYIINLFNIFIINLKWQIPIFKICTACYKNDYWSKQVQKVQIRKHNLVYYKAQRIKRRNQFKIAYSQTRLKQYFVHFFHKHEKALLLGLFYFIAVFQRKDAFSILCLKKKIRSLKFSCSENTVLIWLMFLMKTHYGMVPTNFLLQPILMMMLKKL